MADLGKIVRRAIRRAKPFKSAVKGVYFKTPAVVRAGVVRQIATEVQAIDADDKSPENADAMEQRMAEMLFEFVCDRRGRGFGDARSPTELRDKLGSGLLTVLFNELNGAVNSMGKPPPTAGQT